MIKAFRYFGSKTHYLHHFPRLGGKRVIECFCGSAAYGLNSGLPWVGYETNRKVYVLWKWLQRQNVVSMSRLGDYSGRKDLRDYELSEGELLWNQVNIGGPMQGKFTDYYTDVRKKVPILSEQDFEAIKRGKIYNISNKFYTPQDGDILFIDPPYLNTYNIYGEDVNFELIERLLNSGLPYIFTYGDGARQLWPNLDWQVIHHKRVGNLNGTGSTDRFEYFCKG